ncbi:hypothetical protein DFR58_1296 [Anaerobacterium chartisolvens]|uniref:Flp pilus assembly protein TadB n=1 Tax=Anaerobacterium chartisolvens TaxID=1297424 RepID=A0A369ASI2_9FIRM|nr:hypothetical protein [Anaerobacterium chartisolvens]RCX10414.1 hypothetical protein DFR58_1296 [Anaerobacterium chartisolvens]
MINILNVILFIVLEAMLLVLFGISPKSLYGSALKARIRSPEKNYRQVRRAMLVPRKLNFLQKHREEAIEVLKQGSSRLDYDTYIRLVVVCSAVGFGIGLAFNNILMSLILAGGLAYAPVQYLKFRQIGNVVALNDQLESALNIISNSYIQGDDIIQAVRENIGRVEGPLQVVLKDFLVDTQFIDANLKKAILRMKVKINNRYFRQWCDHLIMCQKDRELKSTLLPIMEEMSDTKKMQAELDTMMYRIYKDFASVVGVVAASIPMMRMINKEWYDFLVSTFPGKLIMAITCAVILFATAYVIKTNKPVSIS